MDRVISLAALALLRVLHALPLRAVARLGRAAGLAAYLLDFRHRRVAVRNLTRCFSAEKSPAEIRALARENFQRIGENFACATKTAVMTLEELRPHVEFVAPQLDIPPGGGPRRLIAAIGHFGNFELYARLGQFASAYQCATTYRALRQPALNRIFQSLRERSGCHFFERRTGADELKAFMNHPGVLLGLLADQAGSDKSPLLPFLGTDCATSLAPALLALRYDCELVVGICYRTGLARWRIEGSGEIPLRENGHPRDPEQIMRDVNRAFEVAVRRDPANWFWVHDRWKPRRPRRAGRHVRAFSPPAAPGAASSD